MTEHLFDEKEQTSKYRLYRPDYSEQVFEHIINYYFDGNQTNEKIPLAVDVGCGSGQATSQLSSYCDRVIGIDISPNQIANAIERDNIEYRCHRGEDLTFLESNSVDLITTATTFHWLDMEAFVEQVQRVLKPNTGVLAIWTYGTGGLDNPKADAVYHEFNQIRLFPYWNSKRWLIDDFYQSLLPLFPYKSTLVEYSIEQRTETTIEKFIGFTETFSACQTFRIQEGEQAFRELIENFRQKLIESYPKTTNRNTNDDETIDYNSMKIITSNPIRLYLMRKQ